MSILFIAAMMMAQTPAVVQPEKPVTVVKKSKQVCEYIEVTAAASNAASAATRMGHSTLAPGFPAWAFKAKSISNPELLADPLEADARLDPTRRLG